jgi:hypothetical protein
MGGRDKDGFLQNENGIGSVCALKCTSDAPSVSKPNY